jgi:hypothetical protein
MIPFDNLSVTNNIDKDDINRITALCKVREQAFFTIMRQSGLTPNAIKKLRLKNLEPNWHIPFKIDSPHRDLEPPVFIGEEGVRYLRQYLATRTNLTPESLLFTISNNPNKEINTKDVSRTFRLAAEKAAKGKPLRLFSLVIFYRDKAKHYLKELKSNQIADDESYRRLYKQHALAFLEIETQITYQIRAPRKWFHEKIESQHDQINELAQTIARNNEYISSILSLLYDNGGNPDTRENVKLGDNFIKLWQRVADKQLMNNLDFLNGRSEYVPCVDILEELTKTLQNILRPYKEARKRVRENNRSQPNNKEPSF